MISPKEQLILFDGYCNLCSQSVSFIFKRDSKKKFSYIPLQRAHSIEGLDLPAFNLEKPASIILIEDGRVYLKSTAALRIARHLRFPWNLFYIFIIIPVFLRNAIYMFISDNRYKWFGKRNECFLPS